MAETKSSGRLSGNGKFILGKKIGQESVSEVSEQLDIIYRDEFLVAINKPSGLLVHRSKIDRHETRFAVQLLRDQLGQWVYPVHRLDKPTSGVLLFALDQETARELNAQFQTHQPKKTYLAVVRGWTDDAGIIDYPLVDGPIKAAYTDQLTSDKPRTAVTNYTTLGRVELPIASGPYASSRYSLVEVRPTTGRRHQIRRHFKHIFHPIVGDTTYGDGSHNRLFREQFKCQRLLLHAQKLVIEHPRNKSLILLSAPIEAVFERLIKQLDFNRE